MALIKYAAEKWSDTIKKKQNEEKVRSTSRTITLYFSAWCFPTSALMANYAKRPVRSCAVWTGFHVPKRTTVSRRRTWQTSSPWLSGVAALTSKTLPRPRAPQNHQRQRRSSLPHPLLRVSDRRIVKGLKNVITVPQPRRTRTPRWSGFVNSSSQSSSPTSKGNDFFFHLLGCFSLWRAQAESKSVSTCCHNFHFLVISHRLQGAQEDSRW